MSAAASLEKWAESLVSAAPKVPGGPWFVYLRGPGVPPVELGPYENPSLAEDDAGKIRHFLVAALREAPER